MTSNYEIGRNRKEREREKFNIFFIFNLEKKTLLILGYRDVSEKVSEVLLTELIV